jgi:hypothetical protein
LRPLVARGRGNFVSPRRKSAFTPLYILNNKGKDMIAIAGLNATLLHYQIQLTRLSLVRQKGVQSKGALTYSYQQYAYLSAPLLFKPHRHTRKSRRKI